MQLLRSCSRTTTRAKVARAVRTLSSQAAASYAHLFSSGSDGYAEFRPTYPQSLYRELEQYMKRQEWCGSRPGAAVDVGAGTCQAAKDLVRHLRFKRVVAVEPSASQRESAIKVISQDEQLSSAIEVVDGTDSALPCEDGSAALVCAAQAAHWFNLELFFDEAHRVLQPNGVLALWSYGLAHLDNDDADAALIDYHTTKIGPYWDARRELVDAKYKAIHLPTHLFDSRMRQAVPNMSFTMPLSRFIQVLGTQSAWVTHRQELPDQPDPRIALLDRFRAAYGSDDPEVVVTYDLTLLLGTKSSSSS